MKTIQIADGKGGFAIPPMHGVVYNLQSVLQKNDKGSWYGWSVTQDRIMGQADKNLYLSAKDFNGSVSKGNVQTKADVEEKAKSSLRIRFSFKGIARSPLQRMKKGIYG